MTSFSRFHCQLDADMLQEGGLSEVVEQFLPLHTLWRAVLLRHIQDALYPGKTIKEKRDHRHAMEWFDVPSHDFDTVCLLAGCEPHYVRQSMQALRRDGLCSTSQNLFHSTRKRRGGTIRHVRSFEEIFQAFARQSVAG